MKHQETLSKLKTLLGSNEIILTGSMALAYHGLTKFETVKDIDLLLINPSATTTGVLDRLQSDKPSKKHHAASPVSYSFIYEGVKIDIWTITSYTEPNELVTKDGVRIASVASIIAAKLSYNRAKDWVQLQQLAKVIFDQTKFEATLSSIKTDSDDEYDDED